ncbi:hypothetical protein Tco_0474306 [Tanacetum coccineum]
MSGPFSMDSRIILPFCLFIMYSSILLFQESYVSFSNIGGRLSAPERIALSARVTIDKLMILRKLRIWVLPIRVILRKTVNSGAANSYVANSDTTEVANSDIANSATTQIANSGIANSATTEIANSDIANSATTEIAN